MSMIAIVAAVAVGYVIGVLQNGIHIHKHDGYDDNAEYNKSVGMDDYLEYYDKNVTLSYGDERSANN